MYKQLTSEQRYVISALLNINVSKKEIAEDIGCSVSTVYREIKRNKCKRGYYSPQIAHENAMIRRERIVTNGKTPPDILKKALKFLTEEQWSPKQISGHLALQGVHISHERIYQEIRKDESGELKEHCRHKMKYRHHQYRPKKAAGKSLIPNRVSIHDRPAEADGKRFGDWEMDLVIGKGQKSAVLTVIERSTNMFMQSKLNSKKPDEVAASVYRLLFPFKKHVLTITTDNGVEFMNHEWIAKKLNTTVYFADPYCSGQKGGIENTNKLLRQYFPKGTDFNKVSQAELDATQHKINRRPREKLNFKSPKNVFYKLIS